MRVLSTGSNRRLRGYARRCMKRLLPILAVLLAAATIVIAEEQAAPEWKIAPRAIDGNGAGYVGAAACAECHKDTHTAWLGSSHAQTFEPVSEDNLPGEVLAEETASHPPLTSQFRKIEGRWQVKTLGRSGKLEWYDFTHVVGRMRVRMYIATMPNGRLQVLPGMLEEPTGEWFDYTHLLFGGPGSDPHKPPVVKPGDGSFWTGPVRAWDAKCARCHTSGHQLVAPHAGERGGLSSKTRQLGIDCEMCHGPGAAHQAHHSLEKTGPDPMVSYRKLARDRQVSVCLRCHMEAEVDDPDFVLGDNIFEHVTPTLMLDPERIDPYGRPTELIYDGVPFSASRCATEGGLTCVSCHDPHGSGERSQLKVSPDNDAMCIRCHEEIGADIGAHTHHPVDSVGARCVSCHMPYLTIERGHGVIADHSISIPRLDMPGDRVVQDACNWCHGGGLWAPENVRPKAPEELRAAYDEWWPDAREPELWMQALASARLGQRGAAPRLTIVANDVDLPAVIRASATRLLGRSGADGRAALMQLARDGDSLVRRSAFTALASSHGTEVDKLLMQGLGDASRPVRAAAAIAAFEGYTRVQKNRALLTKLLPVLEEHAEADAGQEERWFRLGAALQIAGRTKEAIVAYERYLALYPDAQLVRRQVDSMRGER